VFEVPLSPLPGASWRRTIGTAPARSSSQRSPGIDHSVDFATGEISHAASVSTRTGSISAFVWFETIIRPRVSGPGGSPTRSTSRKYSRIRRRNVETSTPRTLGRRGAPAGPAAGSADACMARACHGPRAARGLLAADRAADRARRARRSALAHLPTWPWSSSRRSST
jgi:hypothetical protein